MKHSRSSRILGGVLAAAALLPSAAVAEVNFSYTAGFGAATTIHARADRRVNGVHEPTVILRRDDGGEGIVSVEDAGEAVTSSNATAAHVSARANARLATLGTFVRAGWLESNQSGSAVVEGAGGTSKARFYDRCTLVSDVLEPGTPVPTALFWKVAGKFSQQTPGQNPGRATLFMQALHPEFGFQLAADTVTPVSSEGSKIDKCGTVDLPGRKVGDAVIFDHFLATSADPLSPSSTFGEVGLFIADFDASVTPVVTSEAPARWKCERLSESRRESAQTQSRCERCSVAGSSLPPAQRLDVAFIPVRYPGAGSILTIDDVAERLIYLKDYVFEQSMCAVDMNPILVRSAADRDWLTLPRTQAEYAAIPPDDWQNFRRASSVWLDAFTVAAAEDENFLVSQQTGGVDAVTVITTDPAIRARAFITRSMAGRLEVIDALAGLALPTAGNVVKEFILAPATRALFNQASVIASETDGTGIWAHELGHALFTFWDYYGTAEPFVRGDIARWGLMGRGAIPPPPINVFEREIAGWLKYRDIAPDAFGDYEVRPLGHLKLDEETPRYRSPRGPVDWYIFEQRIPPDGVKRPPEHERITGHVDGIGFDGTATLLVDDSAPFGRLTPGAPPLMVRLFTTPRRDAAILSATPSTLRVAGNLASVVTPGTAYEVSPSSVPENGQSGMVIYAKREIDLSRGRTPACGTIHGFPQQALNVLFAHEFGSCIDKIHNVNLFPLNARDRFTLVPGTSYVDDQANVTFTLKPDGMLSISGTAASRTVVSMEAAVDTGDGGLPASILLERPSLPVDLRVVTADGRHVGPDHATDTYELGIAAARVGGAYTSSQWISIPDDLGASWVVDASRAVANAAQAGLTGFRIDVTVSLIHYDGQGGRREVGDPVRLTLGPDAATSGPVPIPRLGAPDAMSHAFQCYRTRDSHGRVCGVGSPRNAGAICTSENDCGGVAGETAHCVKKSFPAGIQVTLADAFERALFDVERPLALCTALTNGPAGDEDATAHLRSYRIERADGQPRHVPRRGIRVENEFHPASGELLVDAFTPDRLLVPTAMSLTHPIAPPPPETHELDHFKCYRVRRSAAGPRFHPIRNVTVVDQFNQPLVVDVSQPRRLCTPVEKNGEPVRNATGHLLCYRVTPVIEPPQPEHVSVVGIFTNNQFAPERVDTWKEGELCVRSTILP